MAQCKRVRVLSVRAVDPPSTASTRHRRVHVTTHEDATRPCARQRLGHSRARLVLGRSGTLSWYRSQGMTAWQQEHAPRQPPARHSARAGRAQRRPPGTRRRPAPSPRTSSACPASTGASDASSVSHRHHWSSPLQPCARSPGSRSPSCVGFPAGESSPPSRTAALRAGTPLCDPPPQPSPPPPPYTTSAGTASVLAPLPLCGQHRHRDAAKRGRARAAEGESRTWGSCRGAWGGQARRRPAGCPTRLVVAVRRVAGSPCTSSGPRCSCRQLPTPTPPAAIAPRQASALHAFCWKQRLRVYVHGMPVAKKTDSAQPSSIRLIGSILLPHPPVVRRRMPVSLSAATTQPCSHAHATNTHSHNPNSRHLPVGIEAYRHSWTHPSCVERVQDTRRRDRSSRAPHPSSTAAPHRRTRRPAVAPRRPAVAHRRPAGRGGRARTIALVEIHRQLQVLHPKALYRHLRHVITAPSARA